MSCQFGQSRNIILTKSLQNLLLVRCYGRNNESASLTRSNIRLFRSTGHSHWISFDAHCRRPDVFAASRIFLSLFHVIDNRPWQNGGRRYEGRLPYFQSHPPTYTLRLSMYTRVASIMQIRVSTKPYFHSGLGFNHPIPFAPTFEHP